MVIRKTEVVMSEGGRREEVEIKGRRENKVKKWKG